jgi:hypothetical protein
MRACRALLVRVVCSTTHCLDYAYLGHGALWTWLDRYHGKPSRVQSDPQFLSNMSQMPIATYLIDAFTLYAASVTAANAVMRSLLGAILPLAGPKMFQHLGLGWGSSVLAFIALALLPTPFVLLRYGERIRTHPRLQVHL